jgi:hypothetical protein
MVRLWAYLKPEQPFSIFVSVALLKPDHSKLDSYYLCYALKAPVAWWETSEESGWLGDSPYSSHRLPSGAHTFTPLEEQKRLIKEIGEVEEALDSERKGILALQNMQVVLRESL